MLNKVVMPDTMIALNRKSKVNLSVELEKIVNIKKGTIEGFEALLRVDGGNPYYFLKKAREEGKTFRIFKKVFNLSLSIIKDKGYNIGINMEIEDLMDLKFKKLLDNLTKKYKGKIDLSKLTIEALEYSNYDTIDNGMNTKNKKKLFMENLRYLKSKGFKLAIDDLGSGQSTVERIKEMSENGIEIDIIKVDGKFLQNTYLIIKDIIENNDMGKEATIKDIIKKIEDTEMRTTIIRVRKLINKFLNEGKDIIGEWLEIPEHIDFAEWFYGITLGQGYGFNKIEYGKEYDHLGHFDI